MTCACVSGCLCVGNDTLEYFYFSLREATVGAVTFVSSGSPLCSQILTIMCFLFFLCRAHWDTWDTSGRDDCFIHWSTRVDQGGRSQSWGQASTFFFLFFLFLQKVLMALNHQETRSSRLVHTLDFEHWTTSRHSCAMQCYSETGERERAVTVFTRKQLWRWYFCYIEKLLNWS